LARYEVDYLDNGDRHEPHTPLARQADYLDWSPGPRCAGPQRGPRAKAENPPNTVCRVCRLELQRPRERAPRETRDIRWNGGCKLRWAIRTELVRSGVRTRTGQNEGGFAHSLRAGATTA
jgi:hypothetical protein